MNSHNSALHLLLLNYIHIALLRFLTPALSALIITGLLQAQGLLKHLNES